MPTFPEFEHYDCPLLGASCQIEYTRFEHFTHREAVKEHDVNKRLPGFSNCDSTAGCGVQDSSGRMDWAKCCHPDRPKSSR